MRKILFILSTFLSIHVYAQDFEWGKSFGGSDIDENFSMITDSLGNVYLGGYFKTSVDFDPGIGTYTLSTAYITNVDGYILKLDSIGNFLWAKQLTGASSATMVMSIMMNGSGDLLVSGYFTSTVDFDPGPGVFNLTSTGSNDVFLLKLNAAGDFIWAKSAGGTNADKVYNSVSDHEGNIFLSGEFTGSMDADPGPGISNLTSVGNADCFIIKFDPSGNLIWAKSFGSVNADGGRGMVVNEGNDLYITGGVKGNVDLDPGPDSTIAVALFNNSFFISKFDPDGNFLWGNTFSPSGMSYTMPDIAIDNDENILFAGGFSGTCDFDIMMGYSPLTSLGSYDIFVSKLSPDGDLLLLKQIGDASSQQATSICTDEVNNIYILGQFSSTCDFDPGLGTYNLIFTGPYADMYVLKLNSWGDFVFAEPISGTNTKFERKIILDKGDNIFLSTSFAGTIDLDPGPSSYLSSSYGIRDVGVIKLRQDSCANLALIIDSLKNISCLDSGYASSTVHGGTSPFTYEWNTTAPTYAPAATFNTAGIYSLDMTDNNGCVRTSSVIISGPAFFSDTDLDVNFMSGHFRAGAYTAIQLDGFNNGCDSISGQLSMLLDPLVTYVSAFPAPSIISGDTLKWNFASLTYDSTHIIPYVYVMTSSSATIGDSVCFDVFINPTAGDADTINNHKTYCFPIVGSYDPNIKSVYPQGECDEHYVQQAQKMTYSVFFQNTGTADAINIYVSDTLDADLNLNSVRVVGNSHPMITEVLPGNVLKFRFDNIHLADSTSDETHSHGYVIYEVEQQASLASGTLLENTAYIYFDFNPAVVTNTVSNTVVPIIPTCGFVTQTSEQQKSAGINIYPNPTTGSLTITSGKTVPEKISIVDLSGRTVMNTQPVSTVTNLDLSPLQSGVYFVKVKSSAGEETVKLVKQ